MHSIMHVKEPSQNEIEEKTFGTDVSFWTQDIFKVMNFRYKISWTNKAVLSVFFYSNPLSFLTQSFLLLVIQSHVNTK
jgi:hypothetical protein